MKTKNKTLITPSLSFATQLYNKLKKANLGGNLQIDSFSDNSGTWVNLEIGDKALEILFSGDGEEIEDVTVWKNVYEVVDHKKIFGKNHEKA